MLVEVRVDRLGLDGATKSPVVILRELDGERALPIWIGPGEASAIHMQLSRISVGRPLTHDLMVSTIRELGGTLSRVVITRVEQNTYFAELRLTIDGRTVAVDARPSDSIAVALRMDAPIFAAEELLNRVRMEMLDGDDVPEDEPVDLTGSAPAEEGPRGMTPSELQDHLRRLDPEDFGRFTP
ncbi:MAG TPA: bifunctional nuclease family protein [Longimicrobiales bacterium]|nr:bifunctional nuclease family protein [Longimicrobiales bacterium]